MLLFGETIVFVAKVEKFYDSSGLLHCDEEDGGEIILLSVEDFPDRGSLGLFLDRNLLRPSSA